MYRNTKGHLYKRDIHFYYIHFFLDFLACFQLLLLCTFSLQHFNQFLFVIAEYWLIEFSHKLYVVFVTSQIKFQNLYNFIIRKGIKNEKMAILFTFHAPKGKTSIYRHYDKNSIFQIYHSKFN